MKKIMIFMILSFLLFGTVISCGKEGSDTGSSEIQSKTEQTEETSTQEETASKTEALEDGTYEMELTFAGGSGRASISSPAKVMVKGGKAEAELVWSSKNYIYMLIDDVKYEPVNEGGNSTFVVPVILDQDMKVIGCTTAMSEPHEIEYTLHFDSSSAK